MKITVEFESKDIPDEVYRRRFMHALSKVKSSKCTVVNIIPSGLFTFDMIEKSVCELFGCEPKDLQIKTRKRKIALPRQFCHHISSNLKLGIFSVIGDRFGGRDHATVTHSNKTIVNLLKTDREFREKYQSFIESFK